MPVSAKEIAEYKEDVVALLEKMNAQISEPIRLEKYVSLVLTSPSEGARTTGFDDEKTGDDISSGEELTSGIVYIEKDNLDDLPENLDVGVMAKESPFDIGRINITATCEDTELYIKGREVTPGYGLPDWYFCPSDEKTKKEIDRIIGFYNKIKSVAEEHGFTIDKFWEDRISAIRERAGRKQNA